MRTVWRAFAGVLIALAPVVDGYADVRFLARLWAREYSFGMTRAAVHPGRGDSLKAEA